MFWSTEDPFAAGYGGYGSPVPKRRPAQRAHGAYGGYPDPDPAISHHLSRRLQQAREEELLRRQLYQHEMEQRAAAARAQQARARDEHRRRALAQRELQAVEHARRQRRRRLALFTYTVAARKIQRWWRAAAAARKVTAAETVAEALRRNAAVRQGRRVVESLTRLAELEATIEGLPEAGAEELSKRMSGKGISVFEHTLEKLILEADDILTHGSDAARAIRKRLVCTASARLQAFDDEVVAAKAAAEAECEAECEAGAQREAEIDTADEATAASESGESDAPMSPVAPEVREVEWDEESHEWVAMETESDDVTSSTAAAAAAAISPIAEEAPAVPPPPPPHESRSLLPKMSPGPRDKFLGMPSTISLGHDNISEDDPDTDEEDLANAADADLIAPRASAARPHTCRLGCGVPITSDEDGQDSEIDSRSDSGSDSGHSFVEVRAENAQSEDEDDDEAFRCMYANNSSDQHQQQPEEGVPAEMDLTSDPIMQQMANDATNAGAAAEAATQLNALVAKFADDLASIELHFDGEEQSPGVWNAARDLQAAIHSVLPSARSSNHGNHGNH